MLSEEELLKGKTYDFKLGLVEAYAFWNVFPIGESGPYQATARLFCVEVDGVSRQHFATYEQLCEAVHNLKVKYAKDTAIVALGLHKKGSGRR